MTKQGERPRSAVLFAGAIDPDMDRGGQRSGGTDLRESSRNAGCGRRGRTRGTGAGGDGCTLFFGRDDQRARRAAASRGMGRGHLGNEAEQGQEGQQKALSHWGQIGRAESLVQWDRPLSRIFCGARRGCDLPNGRAALWQAG